MEEKRIDAVKKWPEPQSVQDIQVFIGFCNVMVTRSTNHMISTRDHSHDLVT